MVRSIILLFVILIVPVSSSSSEWKRMLIGDRLVVRVEVMSTSREQTMGLGGRAALPEGTGMLFVYPGPGERIFWMKRMLIPIDILWIRKNQVVHIEQQVQPPLPLTSDRFLKRYGAGFEADLVLELPAGYSRKHSITPGQSIRLIH